MKLQDVEQKQVQETLDRMQFGEAHVLDLLGNVCPIHIIHTLTTFKAAK